MALLHDHNFFYGMHNSPVLNVGGIVVYNATNGSGSAYGRLLALFAVISILAFAFVSRTMRRNNRMRFYQIGAVLIASSAVVLVLCPTLGGAVYYGVVNALSTPMYANPYQIIVMNAIADYASQENIVGRVIVRETYQSIGRCLGMAMIVLCSWVFPSSISAHRRDLLFRLSHRHGCLRDNSSSPPRSAESAGIGEITRSVI
ncbi:MAG: hypothetical protein ACLSA6_06050 [Holdemania massiliensis]